MKFCHSLLFILGTLVAFSAQANNSSPVIDCDRKCLYKIADSYMDALVDKNPSRVDWAEHVMFTEMGIQLDIGDGLWNTISSKRDYD